MECLDDSTAGLEESGTRKNAVLAAALLVSKLLLFIGTALFLVELLWRGLHYYPTGSDIRNFAAVHDAALASLRPVALVGSSRVRCGLNPRAMETVAPGRRYFQLGILGNSAAPVLEDLADRHPFAGLIVCEFHPPHLLGVPYPLAWEPDQLVYTHNRLSGRFVEMVFGERLRTWFSFYSFNMISELPRIMQHKFIPAPERADRFMAYPEFSLEIERVRLQGWIDSARRLGRDLKDVRSSPFFDHIPQMVERVRRRGGNVIFVRMPVDGELRQVEEEAYPQSPELIRILRRRGIAVIDYAEMSAHFRCPDGSHLSPSDADRFSALLTEELLSRNLLSRN